MSVPTDLDRLEFELRSVPGVVAVGLEYADDGDALIVQIVVVSSLAPADLRSRVRRIVDANARESVSLEIVVDAMSAVAAARQ